MPIALMTLLAKADAALVEPFLPRQKERRAVTVKDSSGCSLSPTPPAGARLVTMQLTIMESQGVKRVVSRIAHRLYLTDAPDKMK